MPRVTVELSNEEADQLEEFSRKEGVSRLEALRRLIEKPRRFITVPETAERLSVSKPTIYRLCKHGRLRSKKVGSTLRVDTQSLEEYLDGKR